MATTAAVPSTAPLVRLPSIDHGLGTFPDGLLPLRRGSLTDPFVHAHAATGRSASAASSSGPGDTHGAAGGAVVQLSSSSPLQLSVPYTSQPYPLGTAPTGSAGYPSSLGWGAPPPATAHHEQQDRSRHGPAAGVDDGSMYGHQQPGGSASTYSSRKFSSSASHAATPGAERDGYNSNSISDTTTTTGYAKEALPPSFASRSASAAAAAAAGPSNDEGHSSSSRGAPLALFPQQHGPVNGSNHLKRKSAEPDLEGGGAANSGLAGHPSGTYPYRRGQTADQLLGGDESLPGSTSRRRRTSLLDVAAAASSLSSAPSSGTARGSALASSSGNNALGPEARRGEAGLEGATSGDSVDGSNGPSKLLADYGDSSSGGGAGLGYDPSSNTRGEGSSSGSTGRKGSISPDSAASASHHPGSAISGNYTLQQQQQHQHHHHQRHQQPPFGQRQYFPAAHQPSTYAFPVQHPSSLDQGPGPQLLHNQQPSLSAGHPSGATTARYPANGFHSGDVDMVGLDNTGPSAAALTEDSGIRTSDSLSTYTFGRLPVANRASQAPYDSSVEHPNIGTDSRERSASSYNTSSLPQVSFSTSESLDDFTSGGEAGVGQGSRLPSTLSGDAQERASAIFGGASSGREASVTASEAGTVHSSAGRLRPPGQTKETPYSRSPELKVSHKMAERKRRKEMKDLFDDLRDSIPAERGIKASKWEVLSKAIDYIAKLTEEKDEYVRHASDLQEHVKSLETALHQARNGKFANPSPLAIPAQQQQHHGQPQLRHASSHHSSGGQSNLSPVSPHSALSMSSNHHLHGSQPSTGNSALYPPPPLHHHPASAPPQLSSLAHQQQQASSIQQQPQWASPSPMSPFSAVPSHASGHARSYSHGNMGPPFNNGGHTAASAPPALPPNNVETASSSSIFSNDGGNAVVHGAPSSDHYAISRPPSMHSHHSSQYSIPKAASPSAHHHAHSLSGGQHSHSRSHSHSHSHSFHQQQQEQSNGMSMMSPTSNHAHVAHRQHQQQSQQASLPLHASPFGSVPEDYNPFAQQHAAHQQQQQQQHMPAY